jgi:AAA+ ATPase superfamily predicted ATPase
MAQQKFVDREDERRFLEERYLSKKAELIVLSGRRRVGKTELLLQFMKGKPGFYYLASEEGDAANIRDCSLQMARVLGDDTFGRVSYGTWQELFSSFVHHTGFSSLAGEEKAVIILDEFPSLIAHNRTVPSVFQKIWDQTLSALPLMLVLSGSSVSTMETAVLGYKSPLYGRRTGQWQVEPLLFPYLSDFFPYSDEELAMTWFTLGGIPGYLLQFDPDLSFRENIRTNMLRKGSYLFSEAEILLNYEFREPGNYMSIFRAIAGGNTTSARICNATGLDRSMVSKYLHILTRLHIIHEEVPVTAHPGFRRRQYRITDPYLNFWFRFIYPNRIDLEAGQVSAVLDRISGSFSGYCGELFEYLISDLVRNRFIFGDKSFTKTGRWWHKESEIDLVCLDEENSGILFCECKWSTLSSREARRVLASLSAKAGEVQWRNEERHEEFCLFGKQIQGKEDLAAEGYLVFDLEDIGRIGIS